MGFQLHLRLQGIGDPAVQYIHTVQTMAVVKPGRMKLCINEDFFIYRPPHKVAIEEQVIVFKI
ncbi:hypothetical protein D3C81_2165820 [compost metagenome]